MTDPFLGQIASWLSSLGAFLLLLSIYKLTAARAHQEEEFIHETRKRESSKRGTGIRERQRTSSETRLFSAN